MMKKALIALVVGLSVMVGPALVWAKGADSGWVRLSQVPGSDYSSRLARAFQIAAASTHQLLIDESGTLNTPLPALASPAHDGLQIEGNGAIVRAGAKMPRVLFVRTARDVSITGLRIDLGGQAIYGIDVHGDGFRADGIEVFGGRPGAVNYGVNLQGSDVVVSNFVLHDLYHGLRVHAPPSKGRISDIRITGGRLSSCAGRGISAMGQGELSRLQVMNNVFERLDVGCQPIRIDGLKAQTPFEGIHVAGNKIFDPSAERGADDTISLHGVRRFSVIGNAVDRTSDVGLNVSGSGSEGIIAGNRAANAEYCVNIGSGDPDGLGPRLGDRDASGLTRTTRILVSGNLCLNWKYAMLRAAEADEIAFVANAGQIGTDTPYRPAPNAFHSLDARGILYDQNDAAGFTAEPLQETGRGTPSTYQRLGEPVRVAVVDRAGVQLDVATRGIQNVKHLSTGLYVISLDLPLSDMNTQITVLPDGLNDGRASHAIVGPRTVNVQIADPYGVPIDGGFAVFIASKSR